MSLNRHKTDIRILKAGGIFVVHTKIRLCPPPPHFSFTHNVWADLANAAAMLKIPPSVLLGLAWGQTWACAYKCPLCSTVEMSNK